MKLNKNNSKKFKKGIYLLPNILTTTALFAGFYAIILAMDNHFSSAAIAILVAMIFDGLDGRVARLTNTQSDFGAEFDSLSDMVSFGIAPSLVVYKWALTGMGNIGWVVAFLYTACAALRLARFNVKVGVIDKKFFQGLASPAAAAVLVALVWSGEELGFKGQQLDILALITTATLGGLMVSSFPYYSFKDLGSVKTVPFVVLLAIILVFALTTIDPPKIILFCFLLYALSGPLLTLWRKIRTKPKRYKKGEKNNEN
ncbi:MAG: CDP-diacylglycerol--serine O-phosphatidyltransferase [Gammaproteobacteria bacterium]|nr:MAG: CDP-diacylglycerol--serine O-phosphatidyltransferase [Gammaproteobacteria bacterium]